MPKRRSDPVKTKPAKPYADFPMFSHASGRWATIMHGRLGYFGAWADAVLQKYLDQRDGLHAGRTPRVEGNSLQLRDLVSQFLTAKQRKVDADELKTSTFGEYYRVGSRRLIEAFGGTRLTDDFVTDDFGQFRAQLAKMLRPSELDQQ